MAETAASDVAENGAGWHPFQRRRIDQLERLLRSRCGDDDHVAGRQDLTQSVRPVDRRHLVRLRGTAHRQHAHPEGAGQVGHPAADGAEADDAHGETGEPAPVSRLPDMVQLRGIELRQPLDDLQHASHDELGDGSRSDAGG